VVRCNRKRGEKKEGLTRNMLLGSDRAEEVGDGRKFRRCVAVGGENDGVKVDFVSDWMRVCV
jgi:hypothetical protein